jgi:hypothetical protein
MKTNIRIQKGRSEIQEKMNNNGNNKPKNKSK